MCQVTNIQHLSYLIIYCSVIKTLASASHANSFWGQNSNEIKLCDFPSCTLRNMPIPWPVPCPKSSPYCQRGLRASVSNDEPENQTVTPTGQLIHNFHKLLNWLKSIAFWNQSSIAFGPTNASSCWLFGKDHTTMVTYLSRRYNTSMYLHAYTVKFQLLACGIIYHILCYIPLPSG